MRIFVASVGVLAPGLPDWESARSVLAQEQAFFAAPLAPLAPQSLPAAERRRSSPTVRLALSVAEQALSRQPLAPETMAMVFSSYEASAAITHQICEALAGNREVSPTQFHNSVHNAPSGYYSIAMNATLAASSVCRGTWSFAAGLLAAAAQVCADCISVLYVCYDSPLPFPLNESMPLNESTAIAMVLTPEPIAQSAGGWEIDVEPVDEARIDVAWPDWVPESWRVNASARGFSALALLADPKLGQALLPLSPELNLRLCRC